MTPRTMTLCLATFAVGGLAIAAQDNPKPRQDGKPVTAATERVIHVFRADKLKGLDLEDDAGNDIGEIENLLIDTGTGQIAYAVVAQGGVLGLGEEKRLVPWPALHFAAKEDKAGKDEKECQARTSLTKEQVAAAPEFKKDRLIDADVERKAFENAKLPLDPTLGRGVPARLVCVTEIEGAKVHGKDSKEVGNIERVLVDPMDGRIAYTVLDCDVGEDKHIALPWQVTEAAFDDDRKVYLVTTLTKERIEAAPKYDEKDWKRMTSSAWLREVASYHAVEPYWVRTTPASAERSK